MIPWDSPIHAHQTVTMFNLRSMLVAPRPKVSEYRQQALVFWVRDQHEKLDKPKRVP